VSLLIGAIPAVYLGARLSSVAPTGFLRPAIGVALLLAALKLVNVSTGVLALFAVGAVGVVVGYTLLKRARRHTTAPVLPSTATADAT
jgi:hypothetical protein